MDAPLFGDENSKVYKALFWISVLVVGLVVLVTSVLCAVFAFATEWPHWQHLAFIALIIVTLIPEFIFLYWQKFTYLEPKMRVIMIMLAFITLLTCATALMYVFGLKYPGQQCDRTKEFYWREKDTCYPYFDCIGKPNTCVVWHSYGPGCGSYNSTTRICTA